MMFLLAKVYLHFGIGLAACSAVPMYAVCLRARLRHTAGATLSSVGADVPAAKAAAATVSEDGSGSEDGGPRRDPTAAADADAGSVASGDGDTGKERSNATSHTATQQPARFLDRLPEKLGRDVIYLNVSGHYVNAVTTEGSGVILMRFADAVHRARGRGHPGASLLLGRLSPHHRDLPARRTDHGARHRRPRVAGEPHLYRRRPRTRFL